jgi:site-specific DNA recombinase
MKDSTTKTALPIFTVLERAVLYARVSGDDSKTEGRNLTGQLDMGRDYALKKGYSIIGELAEDECKTTSGADWNLPELNKALDMARNSEFDVLITRELDRFARGLGKQLYFENEFKRFGVRVEYVLEEYDDTPEGQLSKNVRAIIAEYERTKIKERMARGRDTKVKAGGVIVGGGNAPYGYMLDENDRLVIDESEETIVTLIFRHSLQIMCLTKA